MCDSFLWDHEVNCIKKINRFTITMPGCLTHVQISLKVKLNTSECNFSNLIKGWLIKNNSACFSFFFFTPDIPCAKVWQSIRLLLKLLGKIRSITRYRKCPPKLTGYQKVAQNKNIYNGIPMQFTGNPHITR